jgi:predicted lipoprotein with Yx(FWY)xxD motif
MDPQARGRAAKIAGVAGITLLVAACGSSSPSSSAKSKVSAAAHSSKSPATGKHSASASSGVTAPRASSAPVTLKVEHTALGPVLAGPQGYTLYAFSRDSSTTSACTGACASTWQPLTGTPRPTEGMSMSGKFGTITRSGGTKQATFDGHPLYTFKSDTAPGQVKGNGDVEFGGRWLAVPASAVTPVAPTSPSISAAPSKPMAPSKSASKAPSHTRSGGAGP